MKTLSWGEIEGELQYLYSVLRNVRLELSKPRSPIDRMVDAATRKAADDLRTVKKIVKRIEKLKLMQLSSR